MIDLRSRYTVSIFVNRKPPSDIIHSMMKHWIAKFGIMRSVLMDNGGEFNSGEMREVETILNTRVCTAAGESPFHNCLCERGHSVTDMMLKKLDDDRQRQIVKHSYAGWANRAGNSLQMWNGLSSHQLVFGTNPNLLGIMTDNLPALDGTTSSEKFASHLNTLHVSRKAYIATKANGRIKRALRTIVRTAEQTYRNGLFCFTNKKREIVRDRESCIPR